MGQAKKTPLYDIHRSLGARIVEFAGFLMPVAYGSIIEEHHAVRQRAGLFDVSHMGEFLVTGSGAKAFVNSVITNDCSKLTPGGLQYTVMCREDGTVVDDLLVYVLDEGRVLLVVNAANIEKDFRHIDSLRHPEVEVKNVSDDYALLAIQGPRAVDVLKACPLFAGVAGRIGETPYYRGFSFEHAGSEVLVSRSGYTGEVGFEVFVPNRLAPTFWEDIHGAGREHGIAAIGLGARDTLRFEASYCLYGHELDDDTSPLEAGLSWLVKLKKEDFLGRQALCDEKKNGPRRALVGLELEGRNIARHGYSVMKDGSEIGKVTSGAFSPTLRKSLCMALIESAAKDENARYEVVIRSRSVPAKLTRLPFYERRAK